MRSSANNDTAVSGRGRTEIRNHCLNEVSPSFSNLVVGQDTRAEIFPYKQGPQQGQQQPIAKDLMPAMVSRQLNIPRAHSPWGGPPTFSYVDMPLCADEIRTGQRTPAKSASRHKASSRLLLCPGLRAASSGAVSTPARGLPYPRHARTPSLMHASPRVPHPNCASRIPRSLLWSVPSESALHSRMDCVDTTSECSIAEGPGRKRSTVAIVSCLEPGGFNSWLFCAVSIYARMGARDDNGNK